jgi:hypothetical protein
MSWATLLSQMENVPLLIYRFWVQGAEQRSEDDGDADEFKLCSRTAGQ